MRQQTPSIHVWESYELVLKASQKYHNPFRDVLVTAEFISSKGQRLVLNGFWDGANEWKIRFAPTHEGLWKWRTYCSKTEDKGLNDKTGFLYALPWSTSDIDANPNRRGFIAVNGSGRYFEYADGTPFYWLGDTLWALYTDECDAEESLPKYLADRKSKGFSVIQCLVGHPEKIPPQNDNKKKSSVCGISPYKKKYELIDPYYFKKIDAKIKLILDSAMAPCLFGMWAWALADMSVENACEYWSYLIARYGSYNVFWCVAGEYYFIPNESQWRQIGRHVHLSDPYHHPTSIHSTAPHSGSRHFHTEDWYDFNLIQIGHVLSFCQLMATVPLTDYHLSPAKPSIMSESWYENHPNCIGSTERRINDKDIRFASYVPLLQGCIGQSYGAHGIWSWYCGGGNWADHRRPDFWYNDLHLAGSMQMKHLRQIMASVKWYELEPHPELATVAEGSQVYCAAIPGKEYVIYVTGGRKSLVMVFTPGEDEKHYSTVYNGTWIDPRNGTKSEALMEDEPYGSWHMWRSTTPDEQDWVLILKRV